MLLNRPRSRSLLMRAIGAQYKSNTLLKLPRFSLLSAVYLNAADAKENQRSETTK